MSLAFHATAPEGEWLNDPNALVFAGGAYRLFAQHRSDAPEFRATGWARLSSYDLLRWTWDGPVIAADGERWAYSGSVIGASGGLEATHTVHTRAGEHQERRASRDAGLTWQALPLDAPRGANVRDPFVFGHGGAWRMLLARPCDWTGWANEPASGLVVLRSADRAGWCEAGTIGPWSPPGVLWEVPVLARLDGRDVLFVSLVDRRDGGAACEVRAWVGTFEDVGFAVDPRWPTEGRPVDLGPDFYALMANTAADWPGGSAFVAWLSNWNTARAMPWPGFAGGPLSLPRRLEVADDGRGLRLVHGVAPEIVSAFAVAAAVVPVAGCATATWDGGRDFQLSLTSSEGSIGITGKPVDGGMEVTRAGVHDWLRFRCRQGDALAATAERRLVLFVDGPAIEVFIEPDGAAASVNLPTTGAPLTVTLTMDGVGLPLDWRTLGPVEPESPAERFDR